MERSSFSAVVAGRKPEKPYPAPEASFSAAPKAFNVKLISPLSAAGTYRVFVERSDLIFIQLEGGAKSILAALAPLFGPLGNLVPVALWLLTRGKAKAKRRQLAGENPEDLLRESESNFKLHQAEIRDAAIEAPGSFGLTGKIGRLNLLVRHGEKIRCEFMSTSDMRRAVQLLVPLLNATLKVAVDWNGKRERFEKKKDLTRRLSSVSFTA